MVVGEDVDLDATPLVGSQIGRQCRQTSLGGDRSELLLVGQSPDQRRVRPDDSQPGLLQQRDERGAIQAWGVT